MHDVESDHVFQFDVFGLLQLLLPVCAGRHDVPDGVSAVVGVHDLRRSRRPVLHHGGDRVVRERLRNGRWQRRQQQQQQQQRWRDGDGSLRDARDLLL